LHPDRTAGLRGNSGASSLDGRLSRRSQRFGALVHDPEKCEAVFRKDHAQSRI
jgi:hypothetical protein